MTCLNFKLVLCALNHFHWFKAAIIHKNHRDPGVQLHTQQHERVKSVKAFRNNDSALQEKKKMPNYLEITLAEEVFGAFYAKRRVCVADRDNNIVNCQLSNRRHRLTFRCDLCSLYDLVRKEEHTRTLQSTHLMK